MPLPSPTGAIQHEHASVDHKGRLQHRVSVFIYAKLIAILAGSVASFTVLAPRWESVAALAAFSLLDSFLLIPYRQWVLRKPQAPPYATIASTGLSAVLITFALYLVGNLASPGVLAYFILLPLTCLVAPEMRIALSSASISSVAYLALGTGVAIGWVPGIGKSNMGGLGEWPAPAVLVVPALLAAGFLTGRIFTMLERRSLEREHQYEETRRRAEAEEIWDTIGRTLISTRDLDQVLTTVIEVINEKMRVEKAWVLLLGPTKDELRCAESLQETTRQSPPPRLPLGEGIPGSVVSSGKPALVTDVSQDPRWSPDSDRAADIATRSVLCVPLVAKETVIGAIELVNKLEGSFTQEDLRLLESIAAPVAIAIQNAQLHRQVQQQLYEVTKLFGLVERAKQEWETSVDAIEEGIILIDKNGRLLRVNRTVANWLHTQPVALIGQQCQTALHGTDALPSNCPYVRVLASPEHMSEAQVEYPRMDGIFRCIAYPLRESRGGLTGAVVVLKNITEEQRLQAHLIQSEKLAATGRMAASLAHEINNPLQAIQGCLDLAQANPADLQKQERYLTMAKSEVDRLATIVQRMLDFYRPSGGARTVLNARELVEDVLVFSYKRLQHGKVAARVEWEATSSIIEGNANQLKQVFLNVILNAVDAMPEGGELVIRGQTVEDGGLWLAIDFIDSGTGIPDEQLDKIFEPFYTTKTTGTGLGLGISHSIVVGHGGRLTVSSTLGEGTTFTVWLPIHSLEPSEALNAAETV
jgi:PAS domain S-box-containing protein